MCHHHHTKHHHHHHKHHNIDCCNRYLGDIENLVLKMHKIKLPTEKISETMGEASTMTPELLIMMGLCRYERMGTNEDGKPIYGIVPNINPEKSKPKSTGISVDGSATYTLPTLTSASSNIFINGPISGSSPIHHSKITKDNNDDDDDNDEINLKEYLKLYNTKELLAVVKRRLNLLDDHMKDLKIMIDILEKKL